MDHRNRKKKLIISYKNLTDEVRELFKEAYPEGYKDYIQKTIKPNGEAIFVVPLETEDTSYMIKFDVKIDSGLVDDDLDKELYGEEEREENEFAPISEAIDKEEGNDHRVGKLNHGAYEEMFEGLPEDKKEFEMANEDIEDEYGDRPDEGGDSYLDGDDDDDDMEPDDDDLLEIEGLLAEADAGEGLLREANPPKEERRGRKKKSESGGAKAEKPAAATKGRRGRKPKEEKVAPKKSVYKKSALIAKGAAKASTKTATKVTVKTTKTVKTPKVTKSARKS